MGQPWGNFRRELHSIVRADDKTGLAASHCESKYQTNLNIIGLFLGAVAKSYVILY
jgi:hypothetical protein